MLDTKDKAILDILSSSGREPASSISSKIGMSVPAVIDRINKLQDSEIIVGYKAVINHAKLGMDISALITLISESSEHYYDVIKLANNAVEVVKCFATTGAGSHVLLIRTESTDSLEKFLRKIQQWPGIIRTETQLILSSNKQ
ncbi:MAG: AsnC family transcriptional regulator [Candidatus Marinimicrobia bacterium]|nr:AsnC family transcriptional regulator [Candidatus Neomarinimicrobiota bacterium]|tara:strand:- start:3695 stop:4123 length:429 start_codon:yes stop_codon:yes gene_type:complete